MPSVRRARFHRESFPSRRRPVAGGGDKVGSVSEGLEGDGSDILLIDDTAVARLIDKFYNGILPDRSSSKLYFNQLNVVLQWLRQ